jgi:aspartate racemase
VSTIKLYLPQELSVSLPFSAPYRSVGVLGGMGPLATVDYLQKIIEETPASNDQEHVPCVAVTIPQAPDRTEYILRGGESPLAAMQLGIEALERAGAGCITIACNTAHHWANELAAESSLPLLHIVDAVCIELKQAAAYGDAVGILSTRGTLASGFYQRRLQAEGYRVVLSTNVELDTWVSKGIALMKQGDIAGGGQFLGYAADALRKRGCDRLLLACTEIPLALERVRHQSHAYSIDATRALARSAVAWWQGEKNKHQTF